MTWVRLDDGFCENEKVQDLSHASFRLHVAALCYCGRNLTDGRISERGLKVCAVITSIGRPGRNVAELVEAGLWRQASGGGWEINDFLVYNLSSDEVKGIRQKRAEAGRRGGKERAKRQASAKADAQANAWASDEADAQANRSTPTRPYPEKEGLLRGEGFKSLPFDKERQTVRLLVWIGHHADEGTEQVVRSLASKLSESSLVRVVESVSNGKSPKQRAAYVVKALKRELEEKAAA